MNAFSDCVAMGGDCCTDCVSCNDGVGGNRTRDLKSIVARKTNVSILLFLAYVDPAGMDPADICFGCYYLGYKETTTPAQVTSRGKLA